ncbi:MAG: NADH-quinone oxidoreductase subunit H [Proteobacteria bacterium]|jgi:formate hydrogenlyase subunit 4|nr:hydrogenase [Desulfocapsa sp.]MBU3944255.1 NADH-quinone oxidoreductase subunit H [Pseudomonadota bacterium]MCG2745260.1 NADH-quinone oxidoreductase subunit H [Desulfobacteraceae bacterium]MBU3984530.1 NADH-quinone oxidoreductase subunit H [Pseudomonadota bacterium]MBU4028237.1 NADH-quinone oxidoreductase subunit H [Pseudomonadota bacterium]
MESIFSFCFAILIAPLLPAVIQKVKANFGGRQGPPLLINYYTMAKLFKKGSVYSTSTTFVFRMGPVVGCATSLMMLLFFPLAGVAPVFSFHGDVLILFYLMGLGRFFTILAALDTASPFEGMGAAREAFFSTLAEATIFGILVLFYRLTGSLSFAEFFTGTQPIAITGAHGAQLILVIIALYIVMLTENSRVPIDDPTTHLELTMIHEVMILDHSGPDLALIELGAWFKLLFYSGFLAMLLDPFQLQNVWLNGLLFYAVVTFIYITIGTVESITARYKMNMVPKFILTPFILVFFATILTMELIK